MFQRTLIARSALCAAVILSACGGSSSDSTPGSATGPTECGYTLSASEIIANVGDTVVLPARYTAGLHYDVALLPASAARVAPGRETADGISFVVPKVVADDYNETNRTFGTVAYLLNDRCEGANAKPFALVMKPVLQYQGSFHYHSTGIPPFGVDSGTANVTYDATVNAVLQSQLGTRRYVDSQTAPTAATMSWSAIGSVRVNKGPVAIGGGGIGNVDAGGVFIAISPSRDSATIQFGVTKKGGITAVPGGVYDFSISTPSISPDDPEPKMNGLTVLGGSYSKSGRNPDGTTWTITLDWPTMVPTQLHCTGTNQNALTGCTPI